VVLGVLKTIIKTVAVRVFQISRGLRGVLLVKKENLTFKSKRRAEQEGRAHVRREEL